MTSTKTTKKCLIISYGPVPTKDHKTIEGGGMRAWGLAAGLQQSGHEVTVAINNSFPQKISTQQGIKLVNWGLDEEFVNLLNSFDSVIVSYCMGDASVFIADRINDDVQLILDAYVPIYIEVSARESKNVSTELKNYLEDIKRFNHVLKRGDYFLCASKSQKTLYLGVLSSLGIINPRSYRDTRILIIPFGIHDDQIEPTTNPYKELGINSNDFVVLWFGGLYPWFRVNELLEAMKILSHEKSIKFVFVGGKNPFNPNPDFSKQYDITVEFADKNNLTDSSVFFIDWVDYEDRINWYSGASVVVSLNQPGDENSFSWRTRVMDFVWGELAIITNGGDPLSEDLLSSSAAIRLDGLSSNSIVKTIQSISQDKSKLSEVKKNLIKLKNKYLWTNILKPLNPIIETHTLPYMEEIEFKSTNHINNYDETLAQNKVITNSRNPVHLIGKSLRHIRNKGLKSSATVGYSIIRTQGKKFTNKKRQKKYIFIGHPMDNTGAPLVLIEIITEFAHKYGGANIQLVTPFILPEHRTKLQKLGVRIDKSAHALSFRMIRLQLGLHYNDFVLLNTIAIYDNYREFILLWLKLGRLKHAYWFIHEDKAQIPVVNHTFLEKHTTHRIKVLNSKNQLSILVPSNRIMKEYNTLLGISTTKVIPLKVQVDKQYTTKRSTSNYQTINFFISGTPSDGRKGQMIAIAAFSYFHEHYYTKSPEQYRDFKLDLISIKDDYISQQIKWMGKSLLGNKVKYYPSMPRKEALKLMSNSNAVICCSLNETFALYVAEGMLMGHIVLRNNSAGMQEQLKAGVNGFFIDHTDVKQFGKVIEKLLNKDKSSNHKLQKMGLESQKMMIDYTDNSYIETILSK